MEIKIAGSKNAVYLDEEHSKGLFKMLRDNAIVLQETLDCCITGRKEEELDDLISENEFIIALLEYVLYDLKTFK
jgi:hypothetical protein